MEINEEHILLVLSSHSDGDTLDCLWNKLNGFDDKIFLAKLLRHCVQTSNLYKSGAQYFKSKPPVSVEQAVSTKTTKVKPVKKHNKNFGKLQRNTHTGYVALVLCAVKTHLTPDAVYEALSLQDLKMPQVGQALRRLAELGYVYKRVVQDGITYKWSDTFDYPFQSFLSDDAKFLKNPDSLTFNLS